MGAWGPAVFSDDLACDIRAEYREHLEDGVPDDEATSKVIKAYGDLDADEAHTLWLALAAAQAALGRLDESVKANALEVIDQGIGLDLWEEAGPNDLAQRKAALSKLRDQLTGPQKQPSKVRRSWSYATDLTAGEVLSYRLADGTLALFRVARIDESRTANAPVLRQLKWAKSTLPSARRLSRLKTLPETKPGSQVPSVSYWVTKNRKKEPDWHEVGFERVGRIDVSSEDAAHQPRSYCNWSHLAKNLDNAW